MNNISGVMHEQLAGFGYKWANDNTKDSRQTDAALYGTVTDVAPGWYVSRTGTVYTWCTYCGDIVVLNHGNSRETPPYHHNPLPENAAIDQENIEIANVSGYEQLNKCCIKSLLNRSTIIQSLVATVAGYIAVAGGVMSAVSQTAVKNERE